MKIIVNCRSSENKPKNLKLSSKHLLTFNYKLFSLFIFFSFLFVSGWGSRTFVSQGMAFVAFSPMRRHLQSSVETGWEVGALLPKPSLVHWITQRAKQHWSIHTALYSKYIHCSQWLCSVLVNKKVHKQDGRYPR